MTYKIVRWTRDHGSAVVKRGLTLEQARSHCQRNDTHDQIKLDGITAWFDGYEEETS